YAIVELSGELRARQQATLAQRVPHLADRVTWLDTLPASFEGVIVGNEVLDAMPVQLYARSGGRWHERGVVRSDDATSAFRFEDRPLADAEVPEALRDIP
ncbi:SAM-dependent methyltransferase, partial [Pseudomonas sp. GW460-13]|uniref:SAM-dependent methyltransferase n=1 Tax=Pseudomonas sp. GW460-13 TaxID=2070590 RepID=UPI000CCABF5A